MGHRTAPTNEKTPAQLHLPGVAAVNLRRSTTCQAYAHPEQSLSATASLGPRTPAALEKTASANASASSPTDAGSTRVALDCATRPAVAARQEWR